VTGRGRSRKPRLLGDILKELIEDIGTGSRLGEATVIAAWQDISGPQIQRATESVRLDRKKLVVKLNSASWRQELHMQRSAWCERLNEALGRRLVDEIVFR
jgi:predicted nucleic acid-binding Zn ribbon protein